MTFRLEIDKHVHFAIIPRKCHDCGRYFFLETGSAFWPDLLYKKSDLGPTNYHCKECTKMRKEHRRYFFDHKIVWKEIDHGKQ